MPHPLPNDWRTYPDLRKRQNIAAPTVAQVVVLFPPWGRFVLEADALFRGGDSFLAQVPVGITHPHISLEKMKQHAFAWVTRRRIYRLVIVPSLGQALQEFGTVAHLIPFQLC